MPSKKKVLDQEQIQEKLVLIDEAGKELTEEEALAEEKRLDAMMQTFFISNPALKETIGAQEQQDEEDITITVDKEGAVVKEAVTKTVEAEKELVLFPAKSSMIERQIIRLVAEQHRRELTKAYHSIIGRQENFYIFSKGDKFSDNFSDMYRKETKELNELLYSSDMALDSMENEILRKTLEFKVEKFISDMFNTVNELKD